MTALRLDGKRRRLTVRREHLPKVRDPAIDPTPEEAAQRLLQGFERRRPSGAIMERHRAFLASVIEVG